MVWRVTVPLWQPGVDGTWMCACTRAIAWIKTAALRPHREWLRRTEMNALSKNWYILALGIDPSGQWLRVTSALDVEIEIILGIKVYCYQSAIPYTTYKKEGKHLIYRNLDCISTTLPLECSIILMGSYYSLLRIGFAKPSKERQSSLLIMYSLR